MNDDERPVSFIRSTRLPLKNYAVIWTREINGKQYVDPIWHVDARSKEEAFVVALKTDRPPEELSVEEEP